MSIWLLTLSLSLRRGISAWKEMKHWALEMRFCCSRSVQQIGGEWRSLASLGFNHTAKIVSSSKAHWVQKWVWVKWLEFIWMRLNCRSDIGFEWGMGHEAEALSTLYLQTSGSSCMTYIPLLLCFCICQQYSWILGIRICLLLVCDTHHILTSSPFAIFIFILKDLPL